MMTARLKVMNAYLPQFPAPENIPFLTGDTIDIILGMIPKHWVEMMITSKIELRVLSIKELVDHLENLEMQHEAGTNPIPKKKNEFKSSTSKSFQDSNITNQTKGICDLYKLFKGANSSAWKNHSTAQCKYKSYCGKLLQKVVIKGLIRALKVMKEPTKGINKYEG